MQTTTTTGCPISSPYASQQIGRPGPLLLQDNYLIDLLAHFDRERIPERVEHAQGYGAFGEFEASGTDVSKYTTADFLSHIGKKTPILCRFSTSYSEAGSSDSVRDPRGFSVKLYTDEGNLDWVYNSMPVFFVRNPAKFPLLVHSQRRNPATHLKDPTSFWDFMVQNPETLHQSMMLFSDRGTPRSARFMNGHSTHTFKWVNSIGTFHYVKIHLITDQGVRNLSNSKSKEKSGIYPDYAAKDLFESIEASNFPSWTCYVQLMTPQEAEKLEFSVFDVTKTWPKQQFPYIEFGKIRLNRNPINHFQEIEQAAFSPSNTVPGWAPSADPLLQARLFCYPDAQRYRLGVNYYQIPVNMCPFAFNPYTRDGRMSVANYGSELNYPSTRFAPHVKFTMDRAPTDHEKWAAKAAAFEWKDDLNYTQPQALWEIFKSTNQDDSLVHNIIAHAESADLRVHPQVVSYFGRVSTELASRLQQGLMEKQKL